MTLPGLHVVVTDAVADNAEFGARVAGMQERCGAGLAVQLRLRRMPVRRILALAERLEEGAVETGGWLVVNRRVDVALAVGAEAVQLGQGALPVAAVRDLAGDWLRIGASVHDLPTADRRRLEGADYLVAGAVYETTSHPDVEPAGPVLIERIVPMDLPVIAIGGVTLDRVRELREAGAYGVAVIGAVWNAPDPVEAAGKLCEAVGGMGNG